MNKIKKYLLIIPILFIIGIQNVKADDEKCYQVVYTSSETFNYVSRSGVFSNPNNNPSPYLGMENYVSIYPNTNYKITFTSDFLNQNSYPALFLAYKDSSEIFISPRDNKGTSREFTSYPNAYYLFAYLNSPSTGHKWYESDIVGGQVILEQEVPCSVPENYNKLYVPNYNDNMCVEVIDKDTIRVFEDSESTDYIDYFVNSHYLAKSGSIDSNYIKNCTTQEKSSSFIYRNDITDILFISISASLFTFFSIYLLFRVFRKRSR